MFLTSFILILRSVVVVAKLVILGISTLTSFILGSRAAVVAKLVMLGISFLTSFTLALRQVLVAKLVISGILLLIVLILALYAFLGHFLPHHLVYLNKQALVLIYEHLIYLLYFSNCLNQLVLFF